MPAVPHTHCSRISRVSDSLREIFYNFWFGQITLSGGRSVCTHTWWQPYPGVIYQKATLHLGSLTRGREPWRREQGPARCSRDGGKRQLRNVLKGQPPWRATGSCSSRLPKDYTRELTKESGGCIWLRTSDARCLLFFREDSSRPWWNDSL